MDLTTALALLAGVVLLALALHAWWSARRAAPKQTSAAKGNADPAERIEPRLGSDAAPSSDGIGGYGSGLPGAHAARASPARRTARIDALIDAIVPVLVDAPISGETALAHLPASRRAGTKPMHVEGLDAESSEWETPQHGRSYSEFQAGVQLANRGGALNEIEYSEFVQKVEAFASAIGGAPDFPDMLEVVARARELDAFANPLDAQLTLTLRANSVAWSLAYLQQCAARHGFVPGALPGRLVLPAPETGAPPLLVLQFDPQAALSDNPQSAALREVSLSLDVPQTEEALEPFPVWHRAAMALADELDAVAVDDQGAPVTLHMYDAIGRELGTLYRALEARDLAAGTPAARRLFS